jgi:hypothetical protein
MMNDLLPYKFYKKKNESEEGGKKGKNKEKWFCLEAIHQCLQIGCKLRCARHQKPYKLITII